MEIYIPIAIILILLINQLALNNYHSLKTRLEILFSFPSIFRILRACFFINVIYLFVQHYHQLLNNPKLVNYSFNNSVFQILADNWIKATIITLGIFIVFFLLAKNHIVSNFKILTEGYKTLKVFFRYMLFWIISVVMFLASYELMYLLIKAIDHKLINHGYALFDYTYIFNFNNTIYATYYKGVYLTLIITISVFILLANVIYKRLYYNNTVVDVITYFIILIILSFGLYSGIFSIVNYIINSKISVANLEWSNHDKLIGYFSVRLTSIILMASIIRFLFITVFRGKYWNTIVSAVSIAEEKDDYRKKLGDFTGIHANYHDIYYFIQVGFYILNTFVAEYLISNNNINYSLGLLLLILPVFVDDYLAIHVYFKKYGSITNWHCKLPLFSSHLKS